MTLAELLELGLQLPEDVELCCHLDDSHLREVWIDLHKQIFKVQNISLAPMGEFEVEGPVIWQLMTERIQRSE